MHNQNCEESVADHLMELPPPPPLPNDSDILPSSTSMKEVLSGDSSMEAEVIEISPPVSRSGRTLKRKQVVLPEVIDIDKDEDNADIVILDEKADTRNKGKAVERDCYHFRKNEAKCQDLFYYLQQAATRTLMPVSKFECSASANPGWHNFVNIDSGSYGDDDITYDKDFTDVDYANLEDYFDSANIPAGVEVSIPLLPEFAEHKRKTAIGHDPLDKEAPVKLGPVNDYELDSFGTYSFASPSSSEPAFAKMIPAPMHGSNFSAQEDIFGHPAGLDLNIPLPCLPTAQSNIDLAASQSQQLLQSNAAMLPVGAEPSLMGHLTVANVQKQLGGSSSRTNSGGRKKCRSLPKSSFSAHADKYNQPPTAASTMSWGLLPVNSDFHPALEKYAFEASLFDPFGALDMSLGEEWSIPLAENSTRIQKNVDEADLLRKFQQFKQFDTVEDHSDHQYISEGDSAKQTSKLWAKSVQDEWRILEKGLPETIFVRVYESRMDLLRAVIVGPEGTPYHDGLFVFDAFFPPNFPFSPPCVYYHSGGLRLNPNLYDCGRVCLSLLNTWSGKKNEKWVPGGSTMLQVLVSIQALILNRNPFFNEPGFEFLRGSTEGKVRSGYYNECAFILSMKTMVYTVRKKPKNFEDFIVGHFYSRAHDILAACKAYTEGAPVGSLVRGGVQDVEAGGTPCSLRFREYVAMHIGLLVGEFTAIGIEDCDKFDKAAKVGNGQVHPGLNP